ncbi:MAG: fatty acid oxidation complex subunit alpha FadJ [Deltaproteobacteria bacterium]|nr:fatty acid oxidation complex subunit alpha FadJ [Deltaproteobacteria bacterium]
MAPVSAPAVTSDARRERSVGPAPGPRSLGLEIRADRVAIVTFDVPGASMNTLDARFMPEWLEILERLERSTDVDLAVVRSGKADGFCAGADIDMLLQIANDRAAAEMSLGGQEAFDRLAKLPFPVVAAIHGPALGGGLELALACSGRVASDDPKTILGLPEVQLGLLPGLGGLKRLPRLVGIQEALDMALTGKNVRPAKARKIGLVDDVVPRAALLDAAIALGRKLGRREPRRLPFAGLPGAARRFLLEENPAGRTLLFREATKRALAKTGGNYPAVPRILEVMQAHLGRGGKRASETEARVFGQLVVSDVSRNLVGIFLDQQSLEKQTWVPDGIVPKDVRTVGILGAGLMGAGIAYASLANGMSVRLRDRDDASLGKGLAILRGILDERVAKRAMSRAERDRTLGMVTATTDYSGFGAVDLVIEAVFEDLELKRRVLREVEGRTEDDVVFASNTSSIPIGRIAEASRRPETVLGMHFFSPVHKMPLLEVIVTERTSDRAVATAVAAGKRMGKTVIVVGDGVGFYTSRILGPYMNEAAHVLAEGAAVDEIDRALVTWGFPVGPMTLLDEVGIDVAAKVGKIVHDAFGERMAPPAIMEKLVADGRAGRKNGKGFYLYGAGKKAVDESVYGALGQGVPAKRRDGREIAERVALPLVNEAIRCLGERILRSPRDGDIGAIFGLGFPPFRGGPFRWVDSVGLPVVLAKLEALAAKHGPRFTPAPLLEEMVKSGKRRFHS